MQLGAVRSASREVKLIAAFVGLVVVGSVAAGVVSSVRNGIASADAANPAFFVDITKVKPNVTTPVASANASTGTFVVDCGKNQNGHRNLDNFIAQPGVRNGAQSVHDYVGNVSTNATSTNASLDAAGTTCVNGDKSTYFWPTLRIDTANNEPAGGTPGNGPGQPTGVATVSCPLVADRLPAVPASAQAEVNQNLALLDQQIAEANQRIASSAGQGGANFINNAILGPLKDKRIATIDRIAIAIGRRSTKPTGLDVLAPCTLNTSGQSDDARTNASVGTKVLDAAAVAPTISCPTVADKLPSIPASARYEVAQNLGLLDLQVAEANQRIVSTLGQGGANFINNAILGPLKDKRAATIDRIAIAIGRTAQKPTGLAALAACTLTAPSGTGSQTNAGGALGGATGANQQVANNDGVIQTPQSVKIEFRGSPVGPVVPMPKFLRMLTGDAKESTNGAAFARKSWTCTGFENRLLAKYPICPQGSLVERIHDFPSCWDGKNLDSANHRSHVVFPNASTGACPRGFQAIPQLRITLTYNISRSVQIAGQYKVDAFPQEKHNPLSDHDDFENVMNSTQMKQVVSCVNGVKPVKKTTYSGDGQDPTETGTSTLNCGNNNGGQQNNGLEILGNSCDNSKLPAHTGFQVAPACVSTAFGEVSEAAKNPSLLITKAPKVVKAGQPFTIQVSTRNLVRDRFLGAAAGGYYLESAFLNADGLTRGHFHTACRMLTSTKEAPDPNPAPAFFVATEDNKGGAQPDTVTIQVTGMPQRGIAQCASWAGDGSHRVPMMQRANETPAIDAVRILVR